MAEETLLTHLNVMTGSSQAYCGAESGNTGSNDTYLEGSLGRHGVRRQRRLSTGGNREIV